LLFQFNNECVQCNINNMSEKDKKKDASADAKKEDQKATNSGRDEDSSSEEEEEVVIEEMKADRVGYMEIKVKDKWRAVHCVLIKGSLFYYKDAKVGAFILSILLPIHPYLSCANQTDSLFFKNSLSVN
jgi:hypothetical protein